MCPMQQVQYLGHTSTKTNKKYSLLIQNSKLTERPDFYFLNVATLSGGHLDQVLLHRVTFELKLECETRTWREVRRSRLVWLSLCVPRGEA